MHNPIVRRPTLLAALVLLGVMSLISLSLAMPSQAAEATTTTPDNNLATVQRSADEAKSLYWAASARLLDQNGDRASAITLALEANRIPNPPRQAVDALEDIAYAPGPRHLLDSSYGFYWRSAFSPDGKMLLTGNQNEYVLHLYDVATGKIIRDFEGFQYTVYGVAFSPDGSKVALETSDSCYSCDYEGSGRELILWDVRTGKQLWMLDETKRLDFSNPTFSPNGSGIVTFDYTANAFIEWDVQTSKELRRFTGDETDTFTGNTAFSPDGSQIAATAKNGKVIVWDTSTAQVVTRDDIQTPGANRLTFSPDGTSILIAGTHEINLWQMQSGEILSSYPVDDGSVTDIFFDADGKRFYSSLANGDLILWDVESGERIITTQTHNTILNMSADGQHLLVQRQDERLEVWDVQQGQEVSRYQGHKGMIYDFAFSPDGKRFVSAGDHGELILWDTQTQKEILRFVGHLQNNSVSHVAFSPDGKTITSVGSEGRLFIWDAQSGALLHEMFASPASIAYSPDGQSLISTEGNDLIQRDVSSGRETRRYSDTALKHEWESAMYNADGRFLLSVDHYNNALLWNVATGEIIRHLPYSFYAMFMPDGQTIVSEDENHDMVFSDAMSGEEIRRISASKFAVKLPFESDYYPDHVVFSPNGQQFLIGDWDGLTVRDAQTGGVIRHFYLDGRLAIFSPDGHFILTKTHDLGNPYVDYFGRDLVLLRLDSPDELIQWTLANRAVGTLDCDQRGYYRITPACNAEGTPSPMPPFITSMPSPTLTPTLKTNLTRTTATPTATVTPPLPSYTPTANQATLTVQAQMTVNISATKRAVENMTLTALALTPSPTVDMNDPDLVGRGAYHDFLVPPKWKVWRYQGMVGETVSIKITADPPLDATDAKSGLRDTYFELRGPDGLLLELVNDYEPEHPSDTLLSHYSLPATGVYEIEVHSAGLNSGGYSLTIESLGIQTATPTSSNVEMEMTATQQSIAQTGTAIQFLFAEAAVTNTPIPTMTPSPTATVTPRLSTEQVAMTLAYESVKQTGTAIDFILGVAATVTPSPTP